MKTNKQLSTQFPLSQVKAFHQTLSKSGKYRTGEPRSYCTMFKSDLTMFLHAFPPFFLKYWFSPFPNAHFYFICFCHLSISPLADNQAFLPIPSISILVLIPVNSLFVLICAFLSPFSHLLLFFSLFVSSSHSSYLFSSCMFSMPMALLRRPWKRLARVRDGLLPGKAKD